jgi:hypothetical protein
MRTGSGTLHDTTSGNQNTKGTNQMNYRSLFGFAATALLTAALFSNPPAAQAQEPGAEPDQQGALWSNSPTLQGTWRVHVRIRDCNTGVERPPFASFNIFARGGTATGVSSKGAFEPGQRSPDAGIWTRVGRHHYKAIAEALILFDSQPHGPFPGFSAGFQRITQEIELKNANEFTSDATTEFFDLDRNLLSSGCASAIGTRFE